MEIAELMAELVQRQRYAFMCQDEQNNASVRAKENMVTWTITHTRIDTLEYGGNKINAINWKTKMKLRREGNSNHDTRINRQVKGRRKTRGAQRI